MITGKRRQRETGEWRPPIAGPPVQRDEPTTGAPLPPAPPPAPSTPPPETDSGTGPPLPPAPPGPEPEAGPVGPPKPPPSPLPLKQTFQLPGGRAAMGVRLARGMPRQADLQGQPFGTPGGGNDNAEILDYILSRFRRG